MSDPVEGGRQALNHWFGYPWYDAKTDGVRRVDVSPPWDFDWRLPFDLQFPASLLQWLAWIVIAASLTGAVFMLVRAYWLRPRSAKRRSTKSPGTAADSVESLPVGLPRGRIDFLEEARRCFERGDYGQAVMYFFSYQLVRLDKRQIIHLERGKTNRQYLREIGSRAVLRGMLEQTMMLFEESYFGRHAPDRGRFESCWSRREEFETLVGSG